MHYPFVGQHVLASISAVKDRELLNDPRQIREILERGVAASGAHALSWQTSIFQPQGCSVVALLSESHLSVHTYPEHRALFFDAFTCGLECVPKAIINELIKAFGECVFYIDSFYRNAQGAVQNWDERFTSTALFSRDESPFRIADLE